MTEFDRTGCILCSAHVSAVVSVSYPYSNQTWLSLPSQVLRVLEIHLCFASGFPGNSSWLCFVFVSLFPGKAIAVTAGKSNEVFYCDLFFFLAQPVWSLGRWWSPCVWRNWKTVFQESKENCISVSPLLHFHFLLIIILYRLPEDFGMGFWPPCVPIASLLTTVSIRWP